ncbi:MAG: hypothetical protein AABY22_11780 [Nanoarchaeota archaeon]
MPNDKLFELIDAFYSLASAEKLPTDSKDLKVILQNIEGLESYAARKKYAERNLKHLSSGSSRIVYLTSGKTIVKLAKNDKGLAQNKAETNPKMKSKFLNKVIGHAKDYSWMETYFLEKITVKDFKKMTNLDFSDFVEAVSYGLKNISGSSERTKPKNFDEVSKSNIYKEIKRIGDKFKLLPGDLGRISSWGEKDGHPVLIDAGLTKTVYADYYDDSSSS